MVVKPIGHGVLTIGEAQQNLIETKKFNSAARS